MTTITLPRINRSLRTQRAGGFTLVEVIISSTLASFVLAGVLAAFLFLGRSGANIQNYNDMESQARKALEVFAEDVRQASAIVWNSSTSITLTVNTVQVIYAYDDATRVFSRRDPAGTKSMVTGVIPGTFSFKGFTIAGNQINALVTASDLVIASKSTKQLQISLAASRSNMTVVDATNTVLSARFILRNKIVTV